MPHLAYIIEWNKQRAAVGSIQLSPSLHAIQGSCFQLSCTMKTVDREILCCRFVKSQRTNCCSCHCSLICTSLCGSERWRWCCLCLTRLTSSWCRCFFFVSFVFFAVAIMARTTHPAFFCYPQTYMVVRRDGRHGRSQGAGCLLFA